jgi:hypothetical protein
MSTPELLWLPPPGDRNASLRAVASLVDAEAWQALIALANVRLDALATIRLDRLLQTRFPEAPPPRLTTTPVRLAILASSTVDHLLPGLQVGALRRGIWLHIHRGDYGQYRRDLADPASALHGYGPNAVLFALDAQQLLAALNGDEDSSCPSAKNGMVREHYARPGFEPLDHGPDGSTFWSLALSRFQPVLTCIRTVEA